jgi:hypothetical protein
MSDAATATRPPSGTWAARGSLAGRRPNWPGDQVARSLLPAGVVAAPGGLPVLFGVLELVQLG